MTTPASVSAGRSKLTIPSVAQYAEMYVRQRPGIRMPAEPEHSLAGPQAPGQDSELGFGLSAWQLEPAGHRPGHRKRGRQLEGGHTGRDSVSDQAGPGSASALDSSNVEGRHPDGSTQVHKSARSLSLGLPDFYGGGPSPGHCALPVPSRESASGWLVGAPMPSVPPALQSPFPQPLGRFDGPASGLSLSLSLGTTPRGVVPQPEPDSEPEGCLPTPLPGAADPSLALAGWSRSSGQYTTPGADQPPPALPPPPSRGMSSGASARPGLLPPAGPSNPAVSHCQWPNPTNLSPSIGTPGPGPSPASAGRGRPQVSRIWIPPGASVAVARPGSQPPPPRPGAPDVSFPGPQPESVLATPQLPSRLGPGDTGHSAHLQALFVRDLLETMPDNFFTQPEREGEDPFRFREDD
jgi:hypothetical protein